MFLSEPCVAGDLCATLGPEFSDSLPGTKRRRGCTAGSPSAEAADAAGLPPAGRSAHVRRHASEPRRILAARCEARARVCGCAARSRSPRIRACAALFAACCGDGRACTWLKTMSENVRASRRRARRRGSVARSGACAQVEGGLGRDGAVDGVHAGLLAWYRSELSHSQRPKARIAQWLEPYLRRRVGDSELFTDFLKGAYRSKTGYESHRDSGERRISGGRFPHNTPIHCHKHLSVCLHSDYQPDSPAESAGEGDDEGGTRTRARGWGGECERVKM